MVRFTFYIYVSTKPNCTLPIHYYHVTCGILGFKCQDRSTGVPVATAFLLYVVGRSAKGAYMNRVVIYLNKLWH